MISLFTRELSLSIVMKTSGFTIFYLANIMPPMKNHSELLPLSCSVLVNSLCFASSNFCQQIRVSQMEIDNLC